MNLSRSSGQWAPDLHWLTDQLAVGGSFPCEQASELAEFHGVGAVIDLRSESCDDRALLSAAGISFLHLPTPDMLAASVAMLDRGVDFARQEIADGKRLLVHCQHGVGRSALLALCIMVDQGMAPLDALRQAKDRRSCISPSAEQYQGWADWLTSRGHSAPDYHSFGCVAYRHLAQ